MPADERTRPTSAPRYTLRAFSAVIDGVHKHTPCPLTTTTGAQRKPGVQARLAAESPKDSRRSHLNPGFKVVWHASTWRRTYFLLPASGRAPGRVAAWPTHGRLPHERGCKGIAPLHPRAAPRHAGQPAHRRGRRPRRPAAVAFLHARTRTRRGLLGGRRRDRTACLAAAPATFAQLLPARPARGSAALRTVAPRRRPGVEPVWHPRARHPARRPARRGGHGARRRTAGRVRRPLPPPRHGGGL